MSLIRRFAVSSIALLAIVLGTVPASAKPVVFYVSPAGSDNWTGVQSMPSVFGHDGPFATVAHALTVMRNLDPALRSRGVTISIRAGNYALADPLRITATDSGESAPLTIEAYRGEAVTLSGGRVVAKWKPYKGAILQAEISKGVDPIAQGCELFYNGSRMDLARWPNRADKFPGGWSFSAGVPEKGARSQFHYDGDSPEAWAHPEKAQVHIFASYDWRDDHIALASVNQARRLFTLAAPTSYDIVPGHRYYVRNVFEELDAPGEWYVDGNAGTLYFYPPDGNVAATPPTLSVLPSVVNVDGAANVTLRGLRLECVTGDAIIIKGGKNVLVDTCEVRNTGRGGVRVDGGYMNTVQGCVIHDTGTVGVAISGGDRLTLTSCKGVVTNNHIYRFGRYQMCYTPGVSVNGVGVSVTHNLIHDAPHAAILISGNDHDIAYNDIHHVCLETSDCGAIYTGRNWTFRGNSIRYNRIHDVPGFGFDRYDGAAHEALYSSMHDAQAVYLDDGVSSYDVVGNLIYRIGRLGIELGGGRDNRLAYNVIVDTQGGIGVDARYITWAVDKSDVLRERLKEMPYQTPPWSTRYPKLAAPMRKDVWPEGTEVVGNVVARTPEWNHAMVPGKTMQPACKYDVPSDAVTIDKNVYWNSGEAVLIRSWLVDRPAKSQTYAWDDWIKTGLDANGIVADPLFTDPTRDDYRLRADSPALKLGIPAIPVADIGLLPTFPDRWRPAADWWDNGPATREFYRVPLTMAAPNP